MSAVEGIVETKNTYQTLFVQKKKKKKKKRLSIFSLSGDNFYHYTPDCRLASINFFVTHYVAWAVAWACGWSDSSFILGVCRA
jgi:hypothetical protein